MVMKSFKVLLAAVALLLSCNAANAQMEYPFYAADDIFDWQMIRKDSFGVYVAVPNEPDKIVYLSRDKKLYRLYNRANNLLEEGNYKLMPETKTNGRHGLWKVYYPGGKLRSKGYYEDNKFVGLWENYYPSGGLKALANYGLFFIKGKKYYDQSGAYKEFYENGQVKVDGFYKMSLDTAVKDATYVVDPKTGKGTVEESKGEIPHSFQSGTWYHYKENGELEKTQQW